jgi:hypothetical protein
MESKLLATCIQRYVEAGERARAMVAGLSADQANWKPAPKKWSVNQCLEHLNKGAGLYADKMGPLIEGARAAGKIGGEPYGKGPLGGRLTIKFLRKDPSKNRFPAPGVFKPTASGYDKDKQLARFLAITAALRQLAEQADGLALGKVRFGSPVSFLIRFNLAQAFELHAIHHHRHLDQVQRVTRHEAFPAG